MLHYICENCNLNVCDCKTVNSHYTTASQDPNLIQFDKKSDNHRNYNEFDHLSCSSHNDNTIENESELNNNLNQKNDINLKLTTISSESTFNQSKKMLKFGSLNVCGLKRKVLYPEFSKLVNDYDIFCVCETKLDRYDSIDVPGYVFFSQCRKQKFIRKSGGIGIFVKQTLSPYITLITSDSDYILWVSINKCAFKTDEDIHLGAVYIPPSDSRFYNQDEVDQFNTEITNSCISNKYVLLMGDFNARTNNRLDFLEEDTFFPIILIMMKI